MNIDQIELIKEMERQFPKELTICAQAIQIRMLQEQIEAPPSNEVAE